MFYLVMVLGATLNILGDILLKKWADGKMSILWGMLMYVADAAVFAYTLKVANNFVTSLVFWEIIVISIGVLWGLFLNGDKLTQTQFLGLVFAGLAILCLEGGK